MSPLPDLLKKIDSPDRRRAGVLFAGSLLIISAYTMIARPPILEDMERYLFIALSIYNLDLLSALHFHYPPLFPLLIAVFRAPAGNLETAALAVNALASALLVFPVYFLGREAYGQRAALLAASFLAFVCFDLLAQPRAEQVASLFIYTGMLAGWQGIRRGKPGLHFIAGFCFGAAFLAKPEGSAVFLAFFCMAGVAHAQRARQSKSGSDAKNKKDGAVCPPLPRLAGPRKSVLAMAAAVAGYLALAGPYLAAYTAQTGGLSLNPKSSTLFKVHNFLYARGGLYTLRQDEQGYFTYAQRIYMEGDREPIDLDAPARIVKNQKLFAFIYLERLQANLKTLAVDYFQIIAPWTWAALLLLGLWPALKKGRWKPQLYLHVYALIPVVGVPMFTAAFPRFFLTMVPWMSIVLGAGAARALKAALGGLPGEKAKRIDRLAGPLVAALLLASALAGLSMTEYPPDDTMEKEFRRKVSLAVVDLVGDDCRFMGELEEKSWWYPARMAMDRQEVLPAADLAGTLALARQTGARYLLVHPSARQGMYPVISDLLDRGTTGPELKVVFMVEAPSGEPYLVYEIPGADCQSGPRRR